jgi:hypothetical protein
VVVTVTVEVSAAGVRSAVVFGFPQAATAATKATPAAAAAHRNPSLIVIPPRIG